MAKNYRASLVGVFGCPVDENPSVVMNEEAFREAALDWRYITMKVNPEDLAAAFAGMKAMNFAGINLTIPHKIEAMKYVDEISDAAKLIGAINIVINRDGRLTGDNTDGKGMVKAFESRGISLKGKNLVVLGAGGAARAICVESALAGAAEIVIANRTYEKAAAIADIINNKTSCKATAIPWEGQLEIPPCDLLINSTSIGLYPDTSCPDINYDSIKAGLLVQDVIPNPAQTVFLKKSEEKGAVIGTGLEMLVYQGAIGIKLWTGIDPSVNVMIKVLEKENQ